MNRKAQVTMFVIIGLVLLILLAVGTYLVSQSNQVTPQDSEIQQEVFAPITSTIQSCLEREFEERIEEIGLRGGYTAEETESFVRGDVAPYQNNAVDLYGDGTVVVPYWKFSDSSPRCGSCQTQFEAPPLENAPTSIQHKVEVAIEQRLRECTGGFDAVRQNNEVELGDIDVTVNFNAEDTRIFAEWPITITTPSGDTYQQGEYTTQLDLPFRQIYDAAFSTAFSVFYDNNTDPLGERFTTQVLQYSGFGESAVIPPISGGLQIGFNTDNWLLQDVRNYVQTQLSQYASYIEIVGPDQPLVPVSLDRNLEIFASPLAEQAPDPAVNNFRTEVIHYPHFPLHVDVEGNGEFIRPEKEFGIGISPIRLEMHNYDFYYNTVHPLVLGIEAPGIGDETYTFNIGIESNLRANQPYTGDLLIESADGPADALSLASQASIPVDIQIDYTHVNGQPPVAATFTCAGSSMSLTDQEPGTQGIQTELPPCFGSAFLEANNPELYVEPVQAELRSDAGPQTYTLEPYEEKEFTVGIRKYQLEEQLSGPGEFERVMDYRSHAVHPDETIMITFNRIGSNGEPGRYADVATINGSSSPLTDQITLTPGKYQVLLISQRALGPGKELPYFETEVEEDVGEVGLGPIDVVDGEDIQSVRINDSLLYGYAERSAESSYFDFTPNEFETSDSLTVPYAGYDIDIVQYTRDLDALGLISNKSFEEPSNFEIEMS